jgi:hypothetical protein
MFMILNVSALGVTPAKQLFEYKEGTTLEGSFKIINDEGVARELVIDTRGKLERNIVLDRRRISLAATDAEQIVSYTIVIPSDLEPGRHTGDLVISEDKGGSSGDDAIVGAVLSVVTQVEIFVPYPGKYAQTKLRVNNADVGENVGFAVDVINLGEFDLATVYANIDIYSDLGQKIESINTNSMSIPADKKNELSATWTANVPVGKYKAIATVIYDGETAITEANFQVGTVNLELQQLTVNNFVLGEIVKMDLLVENKWSEDFDDVHTQVKIYGAAGNVLADFNSPDETVNALQKKVLSSYWDTAGVQEGTYDTKVIIHYAGNKNVETDLQLVVKSNSLEVIGLGYVLAESGDSDFNVSDNLVVILIIVIAILILLNLLWFFILRRMMKGNTKK